MEINPGGVILFFIILAIGLLIGAFIVSEVLLLVGLFKYHHPKPRIFLTSILFVVFSATLYFYKCSGKVSDIEPVKVESLKP